MDSINLSFLIGLSIPLVVVALFWKELRDRRDRFIKKIRNKK